MTEIANTDAYPMGIAGAGRVAQALGGVLTECGQRVVAVAGRDPERTAQVARFISAGTSPTTIEDIPSDASHLLIAVSDDAVESVALRLSRCGFQRGIALHTCGVKGPELLTALSHQGVSCGTLHLLQSFPSAEQGAANIAGSAFAIRGDSEAIDWGSATTMLVGGRCPRVLTEDRSLYHTAAVMASNYVAALIYVATEILKVVGVERSMALSTLAPLVRAATENALKLESVEALTGPIQRGESSTVINHLKGLRRLPNPITGLYCPAGEFAVEMTLLRGLPEAKAAQIKQMLRTAQ